jgi:hypothetical protein
MNIFSRKLILETAAVLFDSSAPGTYGVDLPAGRYEMTLIGAEGAEDIPRTRRTAAA